MFGYESNKVDRVAVYSALVFCLGVMIALYVREGDWGPSRLMAYLTAIMAFFAGVVWHDARIAKAQQRARVLPLQESRYVHKGIAQPLGDVLGNEL